MKKETKQQFESRMEFMPRNKYFSTQAEFDKNIVVRSSFLRILDKVGDSSGIFKVTEEFAHDFMQRND